MQSCRTHSWAVWDCSCPQYSTVLIWDENHISNWCETWELHEHHDEHRTLRVKLKPWGHSATKTGETGKSAGKCAWSWLILLQILCAWAHQVGYIIDVYVYTICVCGYAYLCIYICVCIYIYTKHIRIYLCVRVPICSTLLCHEARCFHQAVAHPWRKTRKNDGRHRSRGPGGEGCPIYRPCHWMCMYTRNHR